MALSIYNTLSCKKEPFETVLPGEVLMYVCGPTVYSKAHIGHAMSALVFDVIRRYLEFKGFRVRCVMNYTDVDDKIINRANQEGVSSIQLANRYIQEYREHLEDLNVQPAAVNPRATQEMGRIIQMIEQLIEKEYAYATEGDVYMRVFRVANYGQLSGRRLEDMQAGTRIEVNERKEHPMDFALWKAARVGEPAWPSPWGDGRPGWHIECSAMSLEHLGEQIDIHGGGNDLIFPHHENEIAQTESLTEKRFARYWVHNGMVQMAGEKMSKSIGNLVTIEEFIEEHEPDALRMMVLNSSYRNPLTYSGDVVVQAERALERMRAALRPRTRATESEPSESSVQDLQEQIAATEQGFINSMDDDFNTAGALGHLFELVRSINHARDEGVGEPTLGVAQKLVSKLAGVLGLRLDVTPRSMSGADVFVDLLVNVRNELRRLKQWSLADQIRNKLEASGVIIEDTKDGGSWRWR